METKPNLKVKIYNSSPYPIPRYATENSAGVDLYAHLEKELTVERGRIYAVPTGIHLEIPVGYEAQIRARSGLALKHGISLVNGIGTIDSDFRGEIKVILTNLSEKTYTIKPGDRIAQMVFNRYERAVFYPVETVDTLTKTDRGEGGFGHSGK